MLLRRVQLDPDVTIGRLSLDGVEYCWVCEDTVRPAGEKIHGQTAIPAGRYQVIVTESNRFQRPLPLLCNVPMFDGIRIHPGNTAVDTDGCLLPGLVRLPKGVGESRLAFGPLFTRIDAATKEGEAWITIQ